jgi:hypothetical protein
MHNPLFSMDSTSPHPAWSPSAALEANVKQQVSPIEWWHRIAAIPEPDAGASYVKREQARQARLLSIVLLFFIPILFIAGPTAFFMPQQSAPYLVGLMIVSSLIALVLNRAGKALWGGLALTMGVEVAIVGILFTMTPRDSTVMQLYDGFLLVELFAVSLLPARSVFLLVAVNSGIVFFDLFFFKNQTPEFKELLAEQFLTVLARPLAFQIMVAIVCYLWVTSATKAIKRANRAEMIAHLEHAVAQQRAVAEQEKIQLEADIQLLVATHTSAMNNQNVAKLSYPEAKVLWPLVGVINSLWTRLQRSQQVEMELHQLKSSITAYNACLQHAINHPQHPLTVANTRTELDALIMTTAQLHRRLQQTSKDTLP